MLELLRRVLSYKVIPIAWTLIVIALLCIPGSYVPGTGLFGFKNLDKVVHVVLFGLNVLFWGYHYYVGERMLNRWKNVVVLTTLLSIVLGVAMEYVQMYFIPNRSFDGGDIIADVVGCLAAASWLMRV